MSESQPQRLNQLDGMFKRHRGERSAQYLAEERYQTFQHLDIREIVFLAFFVEKKQIGEACNKYDLQAIIKQAANLPDRPFVFYSDWVQFSKHVSKNSKLKKRQVELDLGITSSLYYLGLGQHPGLLLTSNRGSRLLRFGVHAQRATRRMASTLAGATCTVETIDK
jgi:hypothetical protein